MINFHNVDCLEFMKGLPDKAFDLAIVDPPYGIGEDGAKNHSRGKAARPTKYADKDWDSSIPSAAYFSELRRVSVNQIVWGGNYMTEHLPPRMGWVFWDKHMGAQDFSDGELAWTSFDCALAKFNFAWNGMIQGDMRNKERRIHPTQKPVALYRWLLKNYAKPGWKILDTHGGSFSHAIACDIEGFGLDICELDPDYFAAGKKRFENHLLQPRMFDAEPTPQPVQLLLDTEEA